jgi:DegV family protein with EDD domain
VTAAVAVVTDSTACLSGDRTARYGIRVVPLGIVVDGVRMDDDPAVMPGGIEAELRSGAAVSTASPAPERFAVAYAAAGAVADAIVSIHLSGRVSGTVDSAILAAAGAPVPVRVVDSRTMGMGLGFAVLAAAEAACAGGSPREVAAAAARRAARLSSFFTVETPGYLLAGGRLGAAPGAGGSVLSARPVLHVLDGRIELLEKVRTRSGAIRRLTELAVDCAGGPQADLAVQYLGEPDRASMLAGWLAELIPGAREIQLARADAVIGIHAGPGMLGIVVAPRDYGGDGARQGGRADRA